MKELPADHLLRRAEAAQRLGISERYLDLLLARGDIEAVRIGRAVRIRASDVARLVREGLPSSDQRAAR